MEDLEPLQTAIQRSWDPNLGSQEAFRILTEALATTVRCHRASIWFFSEDREHLVCHDLYGTADARHDSGAALIRKDFPDYFAAIDAAPVVVAPRAREHPDTACFNETYFLPLDIHSLLDAPIFRRGKVGGVVCCEQTGSSREWSTQEILAARIVAERLGTPGS